MRDHVLITRPYDDAAGTAKMVKSCGLVPFVAPMLKVSPLPDIALPSDFSAYQGLVFTSANAVRAVSPAIGDHTVTVYTVGKNTAEEAKKQGWTNIVSAGGRSRDLSRLLAEEDNEKGRPFLHLSGKHIVRPLEAGKHDIERLVVYEAKKADRLPDELLALLDQGVFCAALFFSARTAENFERLVRQYGRAEFLSSIKALCIGERVVKSLQIEDWQDVRYACTPDGEGMENLLREVPKA